MDPKPYIPFSTYGPRGRRGQVSYAFPLCTTCRKGGGESVQIACKVVYILNGWPNGWHTVANLGEIWTHIAHKWMAPSQNYKRESFSVTVK